MASASQAILAATVVLLFWTMLGLGIGRRALPAPLALPCAPILGWAVFSAAALPVFLMVGFDVTTVVSAAGVAIVVSGVLLARPPPREQHGARSAVVPWWAYAGAALLALATAAAVVPKVGADGVALAAPIFDHAKAAMVDDMVRLGLPPGNPFYGGSGTFGRLAYYYLWHFSAAMLALMTGVSGWEADIALTFFTTFSSALVMIALACWLSGRGASTLWALLFAASASLRPGLERLLGPQAMDAILAPGTGFAGWHFQAAWVPQHIAAASCLVLVLVLLARMAREPSAWLIGVLALLLAATYESSAWIGGIVAPLAAAGAGLLMLPRVKPGARWKFLLSGGAAALLALMAAAPLIHDQETATALRDGGSPVAFRAYEVLGPLLSEGLRRVIDLPAFWIILLPLELSAAYVVGVMAAAALIRSSELDSERRDAVLVLTALALAGLLVSWLLVSTVGNNNDLGWRATLAPAIVLISFAAAALPRWFSSGAYVKSAVAAAALLAALPDAVTIVRDNLVGRLSRSAQAFAQAPTLWQAVRRHAGPDERVANNPLALQDLTPWPVNLSWALLSDRRSCFAGEELALAYVPLPRARRQEVDAQFVRVFAGAARPGDLDDLVGRYACSVAVLTAEDGAWARDPFAASPLFRLVEERTGRWRIYRSASPQP